MDLELVICQMSNSLSSGLPDFQLFIPNHSAVLQNKSIFQWGDTIASLTLLNLI